ncbi:GreA/GreB family elongation factor [Novispirillum sp. DQ9]|uniref:GreA/GreB family elongation factor n=1 Tax=Novispirillum sp. DQ9 TaxID=3398612 RepID=UPI003C7CD505
MLDRPVIWIERADYRRLAGLALAAPQGASPLADELARAIVCPEGDLPRSVVRMGARVVFRPDEDAPSQCAELVFPDQADADGRISVTSALGTAMLGLREGAHMPYRDTDDRRRVLVVERVI